MERIYLDYAAATPLDPRVRTAMEPYFSDEYGNPSSIHERGRYAKNAIDASRKSIARILQCQPDEIIFTSGGTESDNLAISGSTLYRTQYGTKFGARGHLITSVIEHPAVLNTFKRLEKEGFEVTYVPVDRDGLVSVAAVQNLVRADTLLVSIMYVNNEIGTIQPIAEIGRLIKEMKREREKKENNFPLYFHSDASQAAGFLKIHVEKLGIDLMSLNSGKIYGPKGVGGLFVRRGVMLEPMNYGGGQERGLRSGTENVAGIVGFAKAFEIAAEESHYESSRLTVLRDYFIGRLLKEIPDTALNGHPTMRVPNNINVSIRGIDGEALVIYLDAQGIAASTGSACSSAALEPSHVIGALGRTADAKNSLRFTLGRATTRKDIDAVMNILPSIAATLCRGSSSISKNTFKPIKLS